MAESRTIQSLIDSIAASREVADRQIAALNAAVDRTEAAVERTTQNVDRAVMEMRQSADRIEHQVGLMSEHLTRIDLKIEQLADRIHELTIAVNGHLRVAEQQAINISKQADNIGELTKLVAAQANTVAAMINR